MMTIPARAIAIVALCVLTPCDLYAADALGKLFFTPSQRAQFDAARAQRDRRVPMSTAAGHESEAGHAAAPQGPDVVTYNGLVRRNDGKSTVWLNGKPITERTRDSDVRLLGVRRDGDVAITVPQADRAASLRVGQSLEVTSGIIEEPYAQRVTRFRPAEKAAAAAPPPAKAAPAAVANTSAAAKRAARRDEIDPDSGAAAPDSRGSVK